MSFLFRFSAAALVLGVLGFAASLSAGERAALVFGNRDYPERGRFPDLRTVEEDARVMHGLLKAAGFRVGEGPVLNASRTVMEDELLKFAESLKPGDEAVIYFAGHGVQYENKVWLMGSNAEFLFKGKLGEEAVSHETVAGTLGGRGVKIAVILLDCCREVPDQSWLASEVAQRGLRGTETPQLSPPPNILVGFATGSERLTNDNLSAKDVNGPLVDSLRRHWDAGLEFDSLWKAVAKDVYTRSLEAAEAGRGAEIQMPSKYGQTIHDFFFTTTRGPVKVAETTPTPAMNEAEIRRRAEAMAAELAAKMVAEKEKTPASPAPAPMAAAAPSGGGFRIDPGTPPAKPAATTGGGFRVAPAARSFTNSLGMEFVPVAGTGVLFCVHETRVSDYAAYAAENPGVNLSWKDFEIVGQRQTPDHPVVNVSHEDAKAFCAWLSRKEGRTFRLPTDHEWSMAVGIGPREDETALPGEKTLGIADHYPWGGRAYPPSEGSGNYSDAHAAKPFGVAGIEGYSDGHAFTAPVKSFTRNRFGLHDLGGNVWEWCEDRHDLLGEDRVLRGGSWFTSEEFHLGSAYRGRLKPEQRDKDVGFRVVVETDAPTKKAAPGTFRY